MLQSQIEVTIVVPREHFEAKIASEIKTLKLTYLKSDDCFHEYIAETAYPIDFVVLGQYMEWCHNFQKQLLDREYLRRINQIRKPQTPSVKCQ